MKPGKETLRVVGWRKRGELTAAGKSIPSVNSYLGLQADSEIVCLLPDELEDTTRFSSVSMLPPDAGSGSSGSGASTRPGELTASLVKIAALIEIFCKNTPADSIIHSGSVTSCDSLVTKKAMKPKYHVALSLFQHVTGISIRRGGGSEAD